MYASSFLYLSIKLTTNETIHERANENVVEVGLNRFKL